MQKLISAGLFHVLSGVNDRLTHSTMTIQAYFSHVGHVCSHTGSSQHDRLAIMSMVFESNALTGFVKWLQCPDFLVVWVIIMTVIVAFVRFCYIQVK